MREQVQSMGAKVAALQAHCATLQGEAQRWKALWRQSTSANSEFSQRMAHASSQVSIEAHLSPLLCFFVFHPHPGKSLWRQSSGTG